MQASSSQAVTWAGVALDALKILGPAVLALLGSMLALRHQRLTRDKELDAGARMRARELVFNHYQKKLDKISVMSDNLGKSLGEIQVHLFAPETPDRENAVRSFIPSILAIVVMAKHEVEDAEVQLKAFGLQEKYAREWSVVSQLNKQGGQIEGDLEQQIETIRDSLFSLVLIQEALLEARMNELFNDYLPGRVGYPAAFKK